MIRHGCLTRRTVLVIAVAAFVVVAAPSAIAQTAGGGPPWWVELPLPGEEAQAALLQNARQVPVSSFDPKLSPISIDAWLFLTLAPQVELVRPRFVEWRVEYCGGYAAGANPSIVRSTGPELCAKAMVEISADKNVQLVILVANAVREPLQWAPTSPLLREVYIERVEERFKRLDSLDVPELSSLADLLQTPFDRWPKVDFDTQITWNPPTPLPGDTVRVSISVRNTGTRAADRAWVNIMISPCCDHRLEVRRDWFPRLAPGQMPRADFDVQFPEGRGWVHAGVRLGPSDKKILERRQDVDKRPMAVFIGSPVGAPRETVRFEARLAEIHTAAGLREAKVVGSNRLVYLNQDVIVSNADVMRGRVVPGDDPSHFGVLIELTSVGGEKMRKATSGHIGAPIALLVNGDVVALSVVIGPMSSSVVISADYTRAEAERLANGIGIR